MPTRRWWSWRACSGSRCDSVGPRGRLVLALAPLAGFAWQAAGTPGSVVVGVVLAALCHLVLIAWIARAEGVRLPASVALFAVVWGAAIAAPAAAAANEVLQTRVAGWPLGGAPVVEEAVKAAVLLVVLGLAEVRGVRTGIVIGALVGLGFAASENLGYFLVARVQDGPAGLVRAIAIRGVVEGAVHPVLTASTGAGLGIATAGGRVLPGVLGFVAAVAQHALWNGLASPAVSGILCNGVGAGGACRGDPDVYHLVAVPLVVATTLAPGAVGLVLVARRTGSRSG
jgi:protease PrsW